MDSGCGDSFRVYRCIHNIRFSDRLLNPTLVTRSGKEGVFPTPDLCERFHFTMSRRGLRLTRRKKRVNSPDKTFVLKSP
ncbi:hypothetical protein RRG08_064915 [Elysia crispata]|uniref:Uncharacterized protein n=1 Tax=Elysia crispata TaxID=231223 RepID=A0AAE0Z2Q5_9GAST|nr:hypothetical protein RRG08_064915 [Elysia crispata]